MVMGAALESCLPSSKAASTTRRVRVWSDDDAARLSDSPTPLTFTWEDRALSLLCTLSRVHAGVFSGVDGLGRRILSYDEPSTAEVVHAGSHRRVVLDLAVPHPDLRKTDPSRLPSRHPDL